MTDSRRSEGSLAGRSERTLALLIAAVQFINILDFVMVMPLGPDFAMALGIPESSLGLVGGSYTAAAAVAGLLSAGFLDRFDRRRALGMAMTGLVVATALGGAAQGLRTLLAARVAAGLFGGPATALSLAIIADVIPPARRGWAMGIVMSAFSVASVVGVPIGLFLAEQLGWRAPFFAVASLGLVVAATAVTLLPPLQLHLAGQRGAGAPSGVLAGTLALLRRPLVRRSYALTAAAMASGFLVIPNISAFVQGNLGFPREGLKWLYLVGGVVSFGTVNLVGRLVDRFGAFVVGSAGAVSLAAVLLHFFVLGGSQVSVMLLFVAFMAAMGFRNVAHSSLTSMVPSPVERARFQSLQSTVQHGASAAGAILSSQLLGAGGESGRTLIAQERLAQVGRLEGMHRVALLSMALSLVLPPLFFLVQRGVREKLAAAQVVS